MRKQNTKLATIFLAAALVMTGCGAGTPLQTQTGSEPNTVQSVDTTVTMEDNMAGSSASAGHTALIDRDNLFTERDLTQEADFTDASSITLESENDVTISEEGIYVITGTAENTTIVIDADAAKVQLVLDNVTIANDNTPAIYVKSADKVFVTTIGDNNLTVTGSFTSDGDTETDAVIFAKDDIVFNGTGTLSISSTKNGISGKDDIKFTGGSYNITSSADAVEANDSILINDGSFVIKSEKDALHSENSDDTSVGSIYISGGTFNIDAESDGIQATTTLVIDGGTISVNASEGLEATYVQLNGGKIDISASDDGINASPKGKGFDTVIEINDGNLTINMASGDTDALDTNGDLYINGGTVDITAQFAFDFDNKAELNGGTVTVNGETITEITNSMMMRGPGMPEGPMPGFDGQMPEFDGETPDFGEFKDGERPEFKDGERPDFGEHPDFSQNPPSFKNGNPPSFEDGMPDFDQDKKDKFSGKSGKQKGN